MNARLKAQNAYAAGAAPIRTTKSLEYEVIARVTHKLKSASKSQQTDFPAFAKALDDNRRLWQIFASDVASDHNGLPAAVRAQIFYLAEFTFEHTRKVLSRKETANDLIEINTAILRGLKPGTL